MCPGSGSSLGLNTEFSRLSHFLSLGLWPTANQVYFQARLRPRAQSSNPESEEARLGRSPVLQSCTRSIDGAMMATIPLNTVLVRKFSLGHTREVDSSFVLFVSVNVLEMDYHVQGIGQHQQQNQRRDEPHQDGRCKEGCTVTGRGKFVGLHIKGLNLGR